MQREILDPVLAIKTIQKAGGLAVLAHPTSLGLSKNSSASLVNELCSVGLQGIEVYHPLHSETTTSFFKQLCKKNNI